MRATITDEQIQSWPRQPPSTLALLWWGSERHQDGAAALELEHQRRMVSLRVDGTIAVLCPEATTPRPGSQ